VYYFYRLGERIRLDEMTKKLKCFLGVIERSGKRQLEHSRVISNVRLG
jgi:hypothetical protein